MCTNFNFETHTYPPLHLIETQLASIYDVANRKILTCRLLKYFIEIAAWTAHDILSLHPFHFGNSRVVCVVVAFLLFGIQFPTILKNWNEPLVTIRHSIPFHAYFAIKCNISPLSEWI